MPARSALRPTSRSNWRPAISSRSFSPTGSVGVALLAALAGSEGAVVAFCFGSSIAAAGAACLAGASTSLAVSGGGGGGSRPRTRARGRVVPLLPSSAWAGQGQYQDQRRGGQQTVKSCTFHRVFSQDCQGHKPR